MFEKNEDSRKITEYLYNRGFTIDDISKKTEIARLTVGYYVLRINKQKGKKVSKSENLNDLPPNWTLSEDAQIKIKTQTLLLEEEINSYVKEGMPEKACAYLDLPNKLEKKRNREKDYF